MTFTENAAIEILRHKPMDKALRIAVKGGGCAQYSYEMSWTKEASPNDRTFSVWGFAYIVDPKSWLYLSDVTVDYEGGLNGKGFTYNNPAAKRSCGCNQSFGV